MGKKVLKDKKCEFDFDPILQDIGEFGKYQIINYILIVIPIAIYAGITLTYAFTAGNVTYRCKIPECDVNGTNIDYNGDWVKNAVPWQNNKPATCSRYRNVTNLAVHPHETCLAESAFNHSQIDRCTDLLYETDELTIVNAFGITCEENEWKIAAIGTINNLALLIFLPIMGILSDRYGRRTVFIWSMFLCGFFGVFKAFAISYPMFLTMEFVEAGLGAGSFIGAYVIGMELLGPNKRALGGALIMCFDGVGHVVLGFLAMFTRNFRYILLAMHVPAMFFVSYKWLLPESNRWLMTNGRKDEAVRNIHKAARVNGVQLSDEHLKTLESFSRSQVQPRPDDFPRLSQKRLSVTAADIQNLVQTKSIWKSRIMVLRLLNACFAWFVVVFVDYGLTLNSVNLGGDKYVNFILSTLMEVPSNILMFVIMNFFGRRNSQSGSMLICGVCCFIAEYCGDEGSVLRLTMNLIGKFAISTSFAILYMYTAELFPTCIRNGAMSASSMFGRVGSMIVPQLPLLARYWPALPMVVFGVTSFASGLCVLFLPETGGTRLPDTIEEAEVIGKKKRPAVEETQHQHYHPHPETSRL